MNVGWVCSYRKIWDHPIFAGDALRVGVWTWMLHRAAFKDTRFRIGANLVTVRRGQLCVSQRQICTETGMPHRKLRTFLDELTKEGAITQDTTQGRSIITICKYEEYQAGEPTADTGKDTLPTQRRHTKEQDNNKTITPSGDAASPPSAEMVEVSVLSKACWDVGKTFLTSRGTQNPGAMIGRWLKTYSPAEILSAIDAAQRAGTHDPVPYITQILTGGQHDTPRRFSANSDPHATAQRIAFAGSAHRAPSSDCF